MTLLTYLPEAVLETRKNHFRLSLREEGINLCRAAGGTLVTRTILYTVIEHSVTNPLTLAMREMQEELLKETTL